jgi:hypothetical protein
VGRPLIKGRPGLKTGKKNRIAESPINGVFIMPEWGVLGLEPNWQKSEKHVGINNVQGGGWHCSMALKNPPVI